MSSRDVVIPFFAGIGIIATMKLRLESVPFPVQNHNISIDVMIPLFKGIGIGIGTINRIPEPIPARNHNITNAKESSRNLKLPLMCR